MLRSFLDEVESVRAARSSEVARVSERLGKSSRRVLIISGEAAQGTFGAFCNMFDADVIDVFTIKNKYFGGNVNVTGLICACDLLGQLPADLTDIELLIPDVMFNYDGLTLDGLARDEVTAELERRGAIVHYATPPADLTDIELLIPDVMFNYDGLTLDGLARDEVTAELERRGAIVHYATPAPNYLLDVFV